MSNDHRACPPILEADLDQIGLRHCEESEATVATAWNSEIISPTGIAVELSRGGSVCSVRN
jgi:hypothetical protein